MVKDPPVAEGCHAPGTVPSGSHLLASIFSYRNNAQFTDEKAQAQDHKMRE